MTQDLFKQIASFLSQSESAIQAAQSLAELQDLKSQVLGKKSQIAEVMKSVATLDAEQKKQVGVEANVAKDRLNAAFAAKDEVLKAAEVNRKLKNEIIDVTLPGLKPLIGKRHPVSQVFDEARDIFLQMGFDICDGPEIETDYYNFEALNIPADHPARDMQDTFYFPDGKVLRTHTSPVQIHVMEEQKPPIAMVAPGVVYRCDSDITHSPMFHQLEALVVDEGITFKNLRAVIQEFLTRMFKKNLKLRFRASFFPFTEPSAEVDMSCIFCDQAGCRVCKQTGWLEIMGCGMVDPKVFEFVKIDAQKFSGFAFGVGIERMAMLKYGINDIRLLFENDIRFLQQF